VKTSYLQRRVSDDNAYAESLFCGADHAILAARHEMYLKALERNPARWSGATRD